MHSAVQNSNKPASSAQEILTNITIARLSVLIVACIVLQSIAPQSGRAQQDTVEFKFIPPYYPGQNPAYGGLEPPKLIFKPEIVFPNDPKLQGRQAKVIVKALVNAKGIVRSAAVIKSTDSAFNKYALKYARQYRFQLSPEAVKLKQVWVGFSISFKQ